MRGLIWWIQSVFGDVLFAVLLLGSIAVAIWSMFW